MFGLRIVLQPTGHLTFRAFPFSTVHLRTYPFVPPTAVSGFLKRLVLLAEGYALPMSKEHVLAHQADCLSGVGKTKKSQKELLKHLISYLTDYYVLPRDFCIIGAYPSEGLCPVHVTKRQGVREFDHHEFSAIRREKTGRELQLYTWEYLLCDALSGFVLHPKSEELQRLKERIDQRGCKLGKEGFAFVAKVSQPFEFDEVYTEAKPSTVVPGKLLVGQPCDAFPLYRYVWAEDNNDDLLAPTPSPVAGFIPFMAGLPKLPLKADYYTDGKAFIPKALVEELTRGGS